LLYFIQLAIVSTKVWQYIKAYVNNLFNNHN